jgi:hypothetical protein
MAMAAANLNQDWVEASEIITVKQRSEEGFGSASRDKFLGQLDLRTKKLFDQRAFLDFSLFDHTEFGPPEIQNPK